MSTLKNKHIRPVTSLILLMSLMLSIISCREDDDTPTEEPIIAEVTPDTLFFGPEGGTANFAITSNGSWVVIPNTPEWISVDIMSGDGDSLITATVLAHSDTSSRSSTINVGTKDESIKVQIIQDGVEPDPVWILPPIVFEMPPDNTDMRDLTSVQLTSEMGVGWNLGNSLEATPGDETAWGNPVVSKHLIDSVKAAGFTAVRIPVAWSKFSDASTFTIRASWMNRVEEVVNYVLDNDMYAIVNIHWDGGWMQPTYEDQYYVNTRLAAMWKQIATHFRDYNDYLLFAGTNEVMRNGDYGTPTKEYYSVQNGFNKTFVNTVRSTGGRNVYRHLVVQGFNTNIDHTVNFATIPKDTVANRLMMEVHYYDPFNFALNETSNISQWGSIATDGTRTETWANEDYVDAQFLKMKTNFVNKGYGVILGEYGAISRTDVADHEIYRQYYIEYVTKSIVKHGLVPFYWDNGYSGNHGFAIFNRTTGTQHKPELIQAIVGALE